MSLVARRGRVSTGFRPEFFYRFAARDDWSWITNKELTNFATAMGYQNVWSKLAVAPLVQAEQRHQWEAVHRKIVSDESEARLYFPIQVFVGPSNTSIIGLDVLSDPRALEALSFAVMHGDANGFSRPQPALPNTIVDVLTPIYDLNTIPDTVETRMDGLRGVVHSNINTTKLFLTAVTKLPPWPMAFSLYASQPGDEPSILVGNYDVSGQRLLPEFMQSAIISDPFSSPPWYMTCTPDVNFPDPYMFHWTARFAAGAAFGIMLSITIVAAGHSWTEDMARKHVRELMAKILIANDATRMADEATRTAEAAKREAEAATQKAEAATATAKRASQSKTDFVSFICHELRNQLHVILAVSGLVAEEEQPVLKPESALNITTICDAATSMKVIIDDVLDITRMEAGKINMEYLPFDLRKLVEPIIAAHLVAAKKKGLELRPHFQHFHEGVMIGDPTRLRQILYNALSNAIKFTKKGWIEVILSSSDRPPLPSQTGEIFNAQVDVVLCVSDTGIGIPSDMLGLLFDAYSQGKLSVAREHGGTGLGLSIVKQIVELMKGTIKVDSKVGEGTRFTISIPMRRPCLAGIFEHNAALGLCDESCRTSSECSKADSSQGRRDEKAGVSGTLSAMAKQNTAVVTAISEKTTTAGAVHECFGAALATSDRPIPMEATAAIDSPDPRIQLKATVTLAAAQAADPPIVKPTVATAAPTVAMKTSAIAPIHPTAATKPAVSAKPKVLLVEDEVVNQKIVARMLGKDYDVDVVGDGLAALSKAQEMRYEAILMDINMPVMSGWTATEKLRAVGNTTPIIALTGNAMMEDRQQCLEVGMTAVLVKPFTAAELLAILKRFAA